MEITGVGTGVVRSTRLRLSSILVAFALLAGSLLLLQQRADASPAGAGPTAAVVVPGVDAAQITINIQAIVCPILISVRNAFANGPFGGFVAPILNQLLAAFGCTASG